MHDFSASKCSLRAKYSQCLVGKSFLLQYHYFNLIVICPYFAFIFYLKFFIIYFDDSGYLHSFTDSFSATFIFFKKSGLRQLYPLETYLVIQLPVIIRWHLEMSSLSILC